MFALEYMTNAGYDSQALFNVFEHWRGPFGPDEEVRAKVLALTNVAGTTVVSTSEFDQVKAGLTRPASPRRPPTLYK